MIQTKECRAGGSAVRGLVTMAVSWALAAPLWGQSLPGRYFELMEAGSQRVEERLNAEPGATLKSLEEGKPAGAFNPWKGDWRHFPYAILPPAVLYAKKHPSNPRYHDPKMLALAIRIGDLLASEHEKGAYEPRLDSDWDTGLWLEAYRLLESELGEPRRSRWQKAIEENVRLLIEDTRERLDFPWYHSPFIGTSPNHYAWWAALLYTSGNVFNRQEWMDLGARVLRRYAEIEQMPDGYWGEHNRSGPTTGYNHLTFTALALYQEYSQDPSVLPALRRATDFHMNYTYPDGNPVEVINDRNRHWSVNAWGHFGFSHFPDGRRFAEFLTSFFTPESLGMSALGRLAQDALHYHEGPLEPIPQDRERFAHQMQIPAGIRKTGSWVTCLSGILSTQAVNSQFYLDRQGNLSIFHKKKGLIITGAGSKRQPELATFSEKMLGQIFHLPISSRLQMAERQDRLSLAYNTFFADLYVPVPDENALDVRFVISGKGRPAEETRLTLQLCLKSGEWLETGGGKRMQLGWERLELGPQELAGSIRHQGWSLTTDPEASLVWPVFPHNPYSNGPETNIKHAVGALSVPVVLEVKPGKYVRPAERSIAFRLTVE
ncbi:MAG: hypothetical protein AB1898_15665 [Acidobacteriota bacterium]